MLADKQILQIREELENCKKPLFFFHDDPDGLCSFLLFYRFVKEGKGIIIKTTPKIDEKFSKMVQEYSPDKIFILDIAIVEQEFVDSVNVPVVWIDHHTPIQLNNVLYFNPRVKNEKDNVPVSCTCYYVVKQDLWIAMVGCIGDWYWPDFADDFRKEYPGLLADDVKDPETALFETKLGKLVGAFSFSLKGTTKEAMQCAKILTRISSPAEIMEQETPAGKFIYKKYEAAHKEYKELLDNACKTKPEGNVLLFHYAKGNVSFTKDLANELLHLFSEYVIIIVREKDNEMKMSLRSKKFILPPIVKKALIGVNGYGGGHEYACGANIKKEDYDKFIDSIKEQVSGKQ
jgi:single-stranded DNA-specific DHH superfamily exonuclease